MKKFSTLKFIMNTSFLPSICIYRSIILIFIEKKYVYFFPLENILFRDFQFSFPRESSFPRRIPGSDTTYACSIGTLTDTSLPFISDVFSVWLRHQFTLSYKTHNFYEMLLLEIRSKRTYINHHTSTHAPGIQ